MERCQPREITVGDCAYPGPERGIARELGEIVRPGGEGLGNELRPHGLSHLLNVCRSLRQLTLVLAINGNRHVVAAEHQFPGHQLISRLGQQRLIRHTRIVHRSHHFLRASNALFHHVIGDWREAMGDNHVMRQVQAVEHAVLCFVRVILDGEDQPMLRAGIAPR